MRVWKIARAYGVVGRMTLTGTYVPSTAEWVRDQVAVYEATDGEQAGTLRDTGYPVVVITSVGSILDRAVSTPLIGMLLRMSRGPARAAGLQDLQSFLERGFAAFKQLDGAQPFVDEIARRELAVAERLFASHPQPFAAD